MFSDVHARRGGCNRGKRTTYLGVCLRLGIKRLVVADAAPAVKDDATLGALGIWRRLGLQLQHRRQRESSEAGGG